MSVPTGVSIPRIRRGENRFYNPPAIRRRLQQQQQQQQKTSSAKEVSVNVDEVEKRTESDECESCLTETNSSVSDRGVRDLTNLDRFLEYTTPAVLAQFCPKTNTSGWKTADVELPPYFVLGDLWESFKEWSAYGTGVPLVLDGCDSVTQYYVPYLSAIQLYAHPLKFSPGLRKNCGVGDVEASKETSSDGSSEYGAKRQENNVFCADLSKHNIVQGLKGVVPSSRPSADSSSDENETCNYPGQLLFEYMAHDTPFSREPLSDKISVLGTSFPELWTYRSCDLTPSSWISVAWYPIYRIPIGPTLKSLDACFLTFHSLSTPLQGRSAGGVHLHVPIGRNEHATTGLPYKLSLPIFGLASYKIKVSFWDSNGDNEYKKVDSLLQAADNWLGSLNVHHPDYKFFVSHNSFWR